MTVNAGLDAIIRRKDEAETNRYFPRAGYGFITNGWGDTLFFNIKDSRAGISVGQDVRFHVLPKGNDFHEKAIDIWAIR